MDVVVIQRADLDGVWLEHVDLLLCMGILGIVSQGCIVRDVDGDGDRRRVRRGLPGEGAPRVGRRRACARGPFGSGQVQAILLVLRLGRARAVAFVLIPAADAEGHAVVHTDLGNLRLTRADRAVRPSVGLPWVTILSKGKRA